MEERINARRERIRKRIGRKHFPVLYREEGFAEINFFFILNYTLLNCYYYHRVFIYAA
jgi:hypothetical protein